MDAQLGFIYLSVFREKNCESQVTKKLLDHFSILRVVTNLTERIYIAPRPVPDLPPLFTCSSRKITRESVLLIYVSTMRSEELCYECIEKVELRQDLLSNSIIVFIYLTSVDQFDCDL